MNTFCRQVEASLDDSLAIVLQSLDQLKAAQPVDMGALAANLVTAADAAGSLRSYVASALPDATWQSRADLDTLLAQSERVLEARSRLLSLVTELERGRVVHRRALRVEHLNQLRERAIEELRAQAAVGAVRAVLPGPGAAEWIEWAYALTEPGDEVALQSLRDGYPCLDNFIANLEPNMWMLRAEAAA